MGKKEKNFGEIYESFSVNEKDILVCELARVCNADLNTVRAWAAGKRNPRRRSREMTTETLREKGLLPDDCILTFGLNS
jgi:hypothetical protein